MAQWKDENDIFFISYLFFFILTLLIQAHWTMPKTVQHPGTDPLPGGFSFRFSASCLTQLTRGAATSQHNTNLVMSHCLNNTIRKLKSSLVMIFIVTAYEALKNFRKLMTRRGRGGEEERRGRGDGGGKPQQNQTKSNKEPLTKSVWVLLERVYPCPCWRSRAPGSRIGGIGGGRPPSAGHAALGPGAAAWARPGARLRPSLRDGTAPGTWAAMPPASRAAQSPIQDGASTASLGGLVLCLTTE